MIDVLIFSAFGFVVGFVLLWILTVGGAATYRYDGISVSYGVYDGDPIDKTGKLTVNAHSAIIDGVVYRILHIGRDERGMVESIKVEKHTSVWTYWIK